MTRDELKAALKTAKAEGKTTISLASKTVELQAEYDRLFNTEEPEALEPPTWEELASKPVEEVLEIRIQVLEDELFDVEQGILLEMRQAFLHKRLLTEEQCSQLDIARKRRLEIEDEIESLRNQPELTASCYSDAELLSSDLSSLGELYQISPEAELCCLITGKQLTYTKLTSNGVEVCTDDGFYDTFPTMREAILDVWTYREDIDNWSMYPRD